MKKLLLIFAVLLAIFNYGYNQIGIKTGANLAFIKGPVEPGDTISPILGFSFGISYDIKIGSKLSISPEINFIQHGLKTSFSGIKYITKLNYLQIPLMVNYNFYSQANGKLKYFLQFGPYFGYGLYIKEKEFYKDKWETYDLKFGDEYPGVKKLDFGLQIGTGLIFRNNFMIGIRYIMGVEDLAIDHEEEKEKAHMNIGVNLTVGYKF